MILKSKKKIKKLENADVSKIDLDEMYAEINTSITKCPSPGTWHSHSLEKNFFKVRAARLLYFVTRPIKFVFYDIVFAVDTVSVKAPLMSLAPLSFECLSCLLFPIPLVSRNAHAKAKLAKRSKSPARLCIALLATFTTSLATNDSMQITRREGPLYKRQIWRI